MQNGTRDVIFPMTIKRSRRFRTVMRTLQNQAMGWVPHREGGWLLQSGNVFEKRLAVVMEYARISALQPLPLSERSFAGQSMSRLPGRTAPRASRYAWFNFGANLQCGNLVPWRSGEAPQLTEFVWTKACFGRVAVHASVSLGSIP